MREDREGEVLSQTSYSVCRRSVLGQNGFWQFVVYFHHFDDLYACSDHFTSAQIILCMKNRRIGTDVKFTCRTLSTKDNKSSTSNTM